MGYPHTASEGTAQQCQEACLDAKRLIEQVGIHVFSSPIPYAKEATNYRTGAGLMHSLLVDLSAMIVLDFRTSIEILIIVLNFI
jgi:hypothetical protein